MRLRQFYILSALLVLAPHVALADKRPIDDVDLQDVLDPVALSVPPSSKWQPLRVRQSTSPLAVIERPVLSTNKVTKALSIRLRLRRNTTKPVVLTVVNGLFAVDEKGQLYVPIPAQFELKSKMQTINLPVVPISPLTLLPETPEPVGFVGGYDELLEGALLQADALLHSEFPTVFDKMEFLNGHWRFKRTPPSKRLQQWLRWVSFKGEGDRPMNAYFSQQFWQLLVWSIFEGYDAQDYAAWLRATSSIPSDYAAADSGELTLGVVKLFEEHGVDANPLGPATFDFYYNQGVRAFRTRDLRRAEMFFLEAIKKDASQIDAHFNLGLTYYRKRDYQSASAAWLVGTGLDGADASLFYHRGVALWRLEKPLKAAKMFRKALELEPNFARAKTWLKQADPTNVTKPKRKRRWRKRRGRR